jgi:uncharacterized membrane protein YeiH
MIIELQDLVLRFVPVIFRASSLYATCALLSTSLGMSFFFERHFYVCVVAVACNVTCL